MSVGLLNEGPMSTKKKKINKIALNQKIPKDFKSQAKFLSPRTVWFDVYIFGSVRFCLDFVGLCHKNII